MPQLSVPEFEIARSGLGLFTGYHYTIIFQEDRPHGDAEVILKPVSHFGPLGIYEVFQKGELRPDDIAANLNQFYPNGKGLDEKSGKYMRQGVGSMVLERIVEDCLEHDAKVMVAFTGQDSMKSFLLKHGFTPYGVREVFNYKLL